MNALHPVHADFSSRRFRTRIMRVDAGAADIDSDGRIDACEHATGDLDLDGTITGADLAIMLSQWGVENAFCGDIDNDGVVSASDLAMLLSNWNAAS